MHSIFSLLIAFAYVCAIHAIFVPNSAWVAADRSKIPWIIGLLIPALNVFVLVIYAIGVLPLLIPAHEYSKKSPFRSGGAGGNATTSLWRSNSD